jgi:hypothetical protein
MSQQRTFARLTVGTGFLPALGVLLGLLMVGGCEARAGWRTWRKCCGCRVGQPERSHVCG